jgi:hypothetical protein
MSDDIAKLLDSLADRLCQRRALKPLWRFLSAYFAPNGLTDGWAQCYDALRDVRALCGSELQPEERRDLDLLINRVGQLLTKHEFVQNLQNDIIRSLPTADDNA